jgi:hypothetical protein
VKGRPLFLVAEELGLDTPETHRDGAVVERRQP